MNNILESQIYRLESQLKTLRELYIHTSPLSSCSYLEDLKKDILYVENKIQSIIERDRDRKISNLLNEK